MPHFKVQGIAQKKGVEIPPEFRAGGVEKTALA